MLNILMNICGLEKRTDLKIKEASFFISYKIIISWLYLLNGFDFILLLTVKNNVLNQKHVT